MVDSRTNYIQNLANDLKEYWNSYSTRNLHYMNQFAEEFFETEIMSQPVTQIPWRTLVKILYKSNIKNLARKLRAKYHGSLWWK